MKYEDRIILFIDILGFKDLIDSTVDSNGQQVPERIEFVSELLTLPDEIFEAHPELSKSKMVSRFSDCIVVSFKYEEKSEVFYTLVDIVHLYMNFLAKEVLFRGALVLGKIHHTKEMIFGPGLVNAYLQESKAAIYPRVILDEEIIRIGSRHTIAGHTPKIEREHIEELIKKDSDGFYYVDYFHNSHGELNDPDLDFPDFIRWLQTVIEKGLKKRDPGERLKFTWMRERFNNLILSCKDPSFLAAIEKSVGSEYREFYEDLEPFQD